MASSGKQETSEEGGLERTDMASGGIEETNAPGLDGDFASIHGRHIRNEAGGVVSQLSDLDYVLRFLILGHTDLKFEPECDGLKHQTKVWDKIQSAIKDNKGPSVVNLIKEISTNNRNIYQGPVLYCLALCARSEDKNTKNKAYGSLNEVCRTPSHLCQFIEYYTVLTIEKQKIDRETHVLKKENQRNSKQKKKCEVLKVKNKSREKEKQIQPKKENDHAAYGWGRAFKRAICKWFLSFEPERLAYLLTKYRRRCGWSVKTVIKLAHIKSTDIKVEGTGKDKKVSVIPESSDKEKAIGFILRYFRSNLKKAKEFYDIDRLEEGSAVRRVADMLEKYDTLRSSKETELIKNTIRKDIKETRSDPKKEHPCFTIEHLLPKVLSREAMNVEVWRSLIPCIPGDALIRHVGFLTNLGVFDCSTNSDLKEQTIEGLRIRLNDFIIPVSTTPATERPYTTRRPVHPFKLLIALLQYKEGHSANRGLSWAPVDDVTNVLQEAFENSYGKTIEGMPQRLLMAVDVSGSMKAKVNGTKGGVECLTAAAAVAFTFVKTRSNTVVLIFSQNGAELSSCDKFDDFLSEVKDSPLRRSNNTDCTEPLKWALQNKHTDIDAFVVFTVNENVGERNEPVEGLTHYRNACGKVDVKFVLCTMNVTNCSGADRADPCMMDICGCDPNIPLLIEEFVSSSQQ